MQTRGVHRIRFRQIETLNSEFSEIWIIEVSTDFNFEFTNFDFNFVSISFQNSVNYRIHQIRLAKLDANFCFRTKNLIRLTIIVL